MADVAPHDEREGSDVCWPEDVAVGCCFRSAVDDALSLYMWLLWFEPEPALRKENMPAMRRLDLCMVTV